MESRDIYDVFRKLAEDERFKDGGLALGRGVVRGDPHDVLIYEIRLTDFEFDSGRLDALQEVAEREGLTLDVRDGNATLRQVP